MKNLILIAVCASMTFATVANANDLRISGEHQYGCIDKDYFKKTIEMVSQNDVTAFKKVLGAGIASGICTMFQDGETVFLTKSGFMLIKIRREGDATEYWTNTEAVAGQ